MIARLPFAMALIAVAWCVNVVAAEPATVLEFRFDRPEGADASRIDVPAVVAAVNKRLAAGQVKGAVIKARGRDGIDVVVKATDAKEVERIARLVQQPGTLEFRILANRLDHKALVERAKRNDGPIVKDADGKPLARWVPVVAGEEDTLERDENLATRKTKRLDRSILEILVVDGSHDINGEHLQSARAAVDRSGRSCIDFTLTAQGGKLFGRLTGANLPDEASGFTRRVGIILGGRLRSAPSIQSTIGARGQITGNFTAEEVRDLAAVLNAGALPVRLKLTGTHRAD